MKVKHILILLALNSVVVFGAELILNRFRTQDETEERAGEPTSEPDVKIRRIPTPQPDSEPQKPRYIHDPAYNYARISSGPVVVINRGLYRIGEDTPYGALIKAGPDAAVFRSWDGLRVVSALPEPSENETASTTVWGSKS